MFYGILTGLIQEDLYVIIGMAMSILISIILYKNTFNMHNAILHGKVVLLDQISSDIEKEIGIQKDLSQKYETLINMQNFYESIELIDEWTFNPKSIKRVVISIVGSGIPPLLSFITSLLGL